MSQYSFEFIQEADMLFKRRNYKKDFELLNRAKQKASKNERNNELTVFYSRIGKNS